MDFYYLIWAFPLVITIHNLEEAIWLPGWSESTGRWYHTVEPGEFRFAVAVCILGAIPLLFAIGPRFVKASKDE
jgi:Protein of unknown function with HXXEE motif